MSAMCLRVLPGRRSGDLNREASQNGATAGEIKMITPQAPAALTPAVSSLSASRHARSALMPGEGSVSGCVVGLPCVDRGDAAASEAADSGV